MALRIKKKQAHYDVVIVGGGMSGVCAAIASARNGAKTALVHDRPVLGGNASSEIRMHICGASCNMLKKHAEETGILEEIMLENKYYNDSYNYSVWDAVLFHTVKQEENLTIYLNTSMHEVSMDGSRITNISCYQTTTEIHWNLTADIFMDCTGNATLGYMAGAEYRIGSESRHEFDEPDAPDEQNNIRMGNTLLFKAVDRGHPVTFQTPPWAKKFTEEDLKFRGHGNYRSRLNFNADKDGIATVLKAEEGSEGFDCYGLDYGYWWIEVPGQEEDIIGEYETIRDDLVGCVYGIWDHLKNEGDHGAENYDLLWVGMLPGVRESRRLVGDYLLNENDVLQNRMFDDAVAYGGWPVDFHAARGIYDVDQEASFVHNYPGFYTIPYRSYYSANVDNLMMAGRLISASKLGMASARVMGTCAVGGQAAGTAAAMCVRYHCMPREIGEHMAELQQQLIRDDCFIPGFTNQDEKDLARICSVTADSQQPDAPASRVINGWTRNTDSQTNCWISGPIGEKGETLTLLWKQEIEVREIQLTFDPDLCLPIKITLSEKRKQQQQVGAPAALVKKYSVTLWKGGKAVYSETVENNYQRRNILQIAPTVCDKITVTVWETNGVSEARIFEIRIYG